MRFIMPLDYSKMTLEEVLQTYSSIKGHRTWCEREIQNLLGLLNVQYSSMSENRIDDRLEWLEKHTHKLSDITDFLLTAKYTVGKGDRFALLTQLSQLTQWLLSWPMAIVLA